MIQLPKISFPTVMDAPVSKSHLQRELLLSLLADSPSKLFGDFNLLSADVQSAIRCISVFGAQVKVSSNQIEIIPPNKVSIKEKLEINVGESGFLIRHLVSIGFLFARKLIIHADGTLLNRKLHFNLELFTQLGVVQLSQVNEWPLILEQNRPIQQEIELDASKTSQIASGVLIRLVCAQELRRLCLINLVSLPYFEMTLAQLYNRGIYLNFNNRCIPMNRNESIKGSSISIQGDWSGAANLLCIGAITGSMNVCGLQVNSNQADEQIMEVLKAYGADICIEGDTISVRRGSNAAISVDVTHSPDLFPLLCVLASSAAGISTINGTERLSSKESDRLHASIAMLEALGVEYNLAVNEISIKGGIKNKMVHLETFNDHRMVLAALVIASIDDMYVSISELTSLNKSFPQLKPLLQV